MADNDEIEEHGVDGFQEGEYVGQNELIESFYQKPSLKEIIDNQIKSSPWWLISLVAHGVIILLLMQVVTMKAEEPEEIVVVQSEIIEQVEEKEKEELKERLNEREVEVEETEVGEIEEVVEDVEDVVVETEVEVDAFEEEPVENVEEVANMNFDAPVVGEDLGIFGGGGGSPVSGGMLSARGSKKSRGKAVTRYGGGKIVLDTVDRALKYLARVQLPNGGWSTGEAGDAKANVWNTSLALLCFLGAGHTEVAGKYRPNVKKAVKWMIENQQPGGEYVSSKMYQNGIAGMAMAEAAAMGGKARTRDSAQKVMDFIFRAQNKSGSWGYYPRHEEKNDTSVAGWQMMAVKSGILAKLKMPDAQIKRALDAFNRATAPASANYQVNYSSPVKGKANGGSKTITLVGMCIKEFFGMKKTHPELVKPANWLYDLDYFPKHPSKIPAGLMVKKNKEGLSGIGSNGYYSMYYGALVNFQMGGKYWKKWKDGMLAALPPTQDKGGGVHDGSWDSHIAGFKHQHGVKKLGRVGVTCFNALSMEVFWRYSMQ